MPGLLADLLVALHLAFILFTLFGGLLALRWRWAPWVHLPAMAWGAFVEATGRVCPLTPLENALRAAAGEATYQGDFIGRYLVAVVYPEGLTPAAQAVLGILLVVVNAGIYALVWRRRMRRPTT
jgi:hypothetical protein